jgi:hypothetical protein
VAGYVAVILTSSYSLTESMNNLIYEKSDKGREEIATRKYQLASKLRTLLVMVDGVQAAEELLKKVAALGLTEQNLNELVEQDYIRSKPGMPD